MAALRKGQASLGTFEYRLRSIRSQFEKVSQLCHQTHLATESRRTTWEDMMPFILKPRHILHIAHAMHTLEHTSIYCIQICVFIGGRWVGFSDKLAPSRLQVPPTLCPTKPVPNLWLTSCQDHMTPQKTTNTTSSYAGIHRLKQLNYSEFLWPDSGRSSTGRRRVIRSWQSNGKYRN